MSSPYPDKTRIKRDGIEFFDSFTAWQASIQRRHPQATIENNNGVWKAIYNNTKVGVFGNTPGLGYVAAKDTAYNFFRVGQRKIIPKEQRKEQDYEIDFDLQ